MDLDSLNAGQRAAVTAPDGVQLVVAGAGTGKTKTLVHRVAWLVEAQNVPPRDIVLLTFTRRAAQEMLERAAVLVGHKAQAVRGGTFHSFAVAALRRHATHIGYTRDFTILDRSDAEGLVGLVRNELGIGAKERRFPKRNTVLKILSKQINTGKDLFSVIEDSYPQYVDDADDIGRIGVRFAERKRQQNVMDFDDLLVRLVELLRDHEAPRQRLADATRYLLVDEYQDTNHLQAQIAGLLSYLHGNLMVVGDEAQSIYAFRGADVRNILHFPEQFPTAQVLKLEQNYRSTQPILDLANGVLESAVEGYNKELFTHTKGGDRPILLEVGDEHDQAEYVTQRILDLREDGVRLGNIAVLFRSGFHANLLELSLAQANVPFRKFGGIQFVEAAHVKDAFALMRLIANPRDGLAWYRVLQWFEGLGAKSAESMVVAVEASGGVFDPTPYRKRKFGGALAYLAGVLQDGREMASDLPALIDHLVEYYEPILKNLYEDSRKRVRDLETLRVLASRYGDLETFLAEVALDPPRSGELKPSDDEDEWVTLSTIHSAKGLEWHTVFVLQLGNGSFPSGHSIDDADALEEERRLFYVAVTRAKRNLELMQPRFVRSSWGPASAPGCALLDEIPDVFSLLGSDRPPPKPEKPVGEKHPEIAAAEARLAQFLNFYDKKKKF